jgi:hypothetical protein
LASRAGIYARSLAPICSHAAARRCIFLARAAVPTAASFWPPAQVFVFARRHQPTATLLLATASFWPALLPALLRLFGLPHRYSCSLAGTNLQPRCCPPLHLFGLPRRCACGETKSL